jgi:hypothetical protein
MVAPSELTQYSVDELVRWRDIASERIEHYETVLNEIIKEEKRNFKKLESNVKWVKRLNKAINRKCFPCKKTVHIIND